MSKSSTGVAETVESLMNRGNRLLQLAADLAAEYGIDTAPFKKASSDASGESRESKSRKSKPDGSRLEQLRKYLQQKGPQTRKQIEADTEIPIGTVATLLTKHGKRDDDGRWTLKD